MVGDEPPTIERVRRIVAKRDLGKDRDAQVLEDVLCLVFIETQLHDLRLRLAGPKMLEVVRKTLGKMSAEAMELALTIELPDDDRALIVEASGAGGGSKA
jgi:hypothetical protein